MQVLKRGSGESSLSASGMKQKQRQMSGDSPLPKKEIVCNFSLNSTKARNYFANFKGEVGQR